MTRSVVSRGAIALPFDALVRAARAWYVREIERCGLADRERDFERSRTRAVDGSSSTSAALAKFARAAESCRRAGTGGVFDGVFDERNAAAAAELAELRAHYAAMDVALTAAVEREDCLAARKPTRRRDDASDGENDDASDGENDDASDENAFRESVSATETNASSHSFDSLLPALDPETDERRGGRLATGALTLSFLVGAAEDVVATRGGCAAAVDAPVGSYYPVRAYDRVAQEMARCGLDGVSREWLAREWGPAGGSHAFAATLDEFQAAADACVSESGFKSGTYRDARRHAVRADGARLLSIAEHFRRAESALLGCRGGRRAYSAAGRLADTLEGFRDVLEAGGCLYDESPAGNAVEPSQENAVEPSQAARRAREADSESESVSVDADESVSVDADEIVSVDADESVSVDADSNGASSGLSAWGAMGVGALAGAVVVAVAWAVNRACGGGGGGARKSRRAYARERGDGGGGGARGVWRLVPLGDSTATSRLVPPGTFRSSRISIGVPIGVPIEALRRDRPRPSRVSSRARRSSSNPRLETQSLHLRARGGNQTAPRGGRRRERGAGAVTVTRAESRRHRHARRRRFAWTSMRRPRGDASGANRTRADRARLPGRVREPRRAAETIRARSDERNVTRRGARDGSNDIDIDIDDDDDDARYGTYGRRRRVGQRRTAVRRVETRLHAGVRSPEGSSAIRLFSLRGKGRGMLCEVDATMCHTTVRRFAASSPLRVLLRPRLRLRLRRSEFFEAILIPLGYPPLRHLALAVRHLGPVHDAGEGTVFVHCARSIGVVRRMNEGHAREGKGAHRNPRSGLGTGTGEMGTKAHRRRGPSHPSRRSLRC